MIFKTWYANPMRLLGIDYGTKRVGVALSDAEGRMAFPHAVFPCDAALIKSIEEVVKEKGVEKIVVGYSVDKNGEPNKLHTAVKKLVQDLITEIELPIELEPEQYTTQEAKRIQGKTDMTDASAATIILNSYISRHKTH